MRIAVIGAGSVGKALGSSFMRAGHEVTFAARDAAKARQVAAEIGAAASDKVGPAAAWADVIVLAVPFGAVKEVAATIAGGAKGKVVIDVSNPIKPDYSGLAVEAGTSGAEMLAGYLSGSTVVKAFNTLFASLQANPNADGVKVDALFATDDERARAVVWDLIDSIGFRPVYAGGLVGARDLEALAWFNIRLNASLNGDWKSTLVLVGAPAGSLAAPVAA